MTILFNTINLEFDLENEKVLSDVIHFLQEFAFTHGHVLADVLVDKTPFLVSNASTSQQEINSIELLEVNTKTIVEEVGELFTTLKVYISEFQLQLKNKDEFLEDKKSKIEEILWITGGFFSCSKLLKLSLNFVFVQDKFLEETLFSLELFAGTLESKIHDSEFFYNLCREGILDKLLLLKDSFLERISDLYNFFYSENEDYIQTKMKENLIKSLSQSEALMKTFSKIADYLQTGKDREALGLFQKSIYLYDFFSALLDRLISLNLANEKDFTDLKKVLLKNIEDITKALEEKDIVTSCDVLEYEYLEKLSQYAQSLQKIVS